MQITAPFEKDLERKGYTLLQHFGTCIEAFKAKRTCRYATAFILHVPGPKPWALYVAGRLSS